jgi:iron complex outermembrane receptor protein
MRLSVVTTRTLLATTASFALALPAAAQTAGESQAQAQTSTVSDPAPDQDERSLGEIIVTATKRASTVQDVPFSINAQTQEDIQRANAGTIEDISRNVAGLQVQNLGPGQSQVSVRGVSAGQIVRDQPGVKEQVGVYLDESVVSLSLFTPDFDLFDLNRVETLRGPQGTLFGSGSVGGTIRYITNQPRIGRNEGMVEANLNTLADGGTGGHVKGMLNAALSDTVSLRAVGYRTKFAGFIDAIGPAKGENINDGERSGVRLSLLWQPSERVRITPRYVLQTIEANGFNREEIFNLYANTFTSPASIPQERTQYLLLREKFEDKTRLADLTMSVDLGPVEVTSVTSYINRDILVSRDASALTGSVSIDLAFPVAAVNLPSNLVDKTDLAQWSQEVRASSTGQGPFSWVVGAFYSQVDRVYRQRLPTPGYDAFTDARFGAGTSAGAANGFPLNSPYNSDLPYDIEQQAIFGEATYDFGQVKLTAGGRYYDFEESRDFISGGLFSNGDRRIGDETSSNGFSPRAIVSWEPNRNLTVNLQAAKGFRLGGVNDPLNVPLCNAQDLALFGGFQNYDDETLWNYEGGVKYSRGPVTFNAAAFYTDIKNLQVTLDAGSCSSRVVFNVEKAHTRGLEAEFNVRPFRGFDLSFAGSLIEAEFDYTLPGTVGGVPFATVTGIREGNRLPSVPKYQFATTATYGTRINDNAEAFVSASWQRVGSRYTQPADQENNPRNFVSGLPFRGASGNGVTRVDLLLPAYDLINLSAGMDFDSGFGVQLYANNLFDENALLSFDRERGGRARLGYNIGRPREIGVTLRKRFGR